jgi:hypothetical protein
MARHARAMPMICRSEAQSIGVLLTPQPLPPISQSDWVIGLALLVASAVLLTWVQNSSRRTQLTAERSPIFGGSVFAVPDRRVAVPGPRDVVDHILGWRATGPVYDPSRLWSACRSCNAWTATAQRGNGQAPRGQEAAARPPSNFPRWLFTYPCPHREFRRHRLVHRRARPSQQGLARGARQRRRRRHHGHPRGLLESIRYTQTPTRPAESLRLARTLRKRTCRVRAHGS